MDAVLGVALLLGALVLASYGAVGLGVGVGLRLGVGFGL